MRAESVAPSLLRTVHGGRVVMPTRAFTTGSENATSGRRACLKRLLIAAPGVLALPTVLAQVQAAPGKSEHANDWLDPIRDAVRPWLDDRSADGEERFAARLA